LINFKDYLLFFRNFQVWKIFHIFPFFLFLLFLFLLSFFLLSFSFLSLSPSHNREALTDARTESTPPLPPWRLPLQRPPPWALPRSCPPRPHPCYPLLLPPPSSLPQDCHATINGASSPTTAASHGEPHTISFFFVR
jgi:hypothetical protein